MALAGLLCLSERLLSLSIRIGAGDLFGRRFGRIRNKAGTEGPRTALPGVLGSSGLLPVTAVFTLAGNFTLSRLVSLARFLPLTRFPSLARFFALTGLLIRGHRLTLVAELRGGFKSLADRLVGDLGLPGDLLCVFADLPLGLSEAVLGIL